ncbi:MAG: ferredoxin [Oligoflexia bacterium]|nr:MAG: ferredoxin [Oligoflexia bacterium]
MYKAHLFICTNAPENPAKCGHKNAEKLHAALKEKCSKMPWAKDVRINKSGCLGPCERGINAVLYPQNKWFHELKESDVDLLFAEVEKAIKADFA